MLEDETPASQDGASVSRARRWWASATFGARNPRRRVAGLVASGVVSGFGESAVVVLVVGLVAGGSGSRLPLVGVRPGDWAIAGLALGMVGLLAAAHATTAWISARSARDVQGALQSQLLTTYLAAPWAAQSAVRTGELQELVTVRSQLLASGTQEVGQGLSAALNLVVLIVASFVLSPLATLGLLLSLAVVVAVSIVLRRNLRTAVGEASEAQGSLAVELTEAALLARETRVFGVTGAATARMTGEIAAAARRSGRVRLALAITPPLTRDVTVALLVVALAVVVSQGTAGTAVLGATVVLVLRALSHAQSLASLAARWTEREASVQRIRDRLDAWRAPAVHGARPCPPVERLAVRDLAFTYPGAERPALDGVSLELRRGELVGVVGRTGSGKSTLAAALLALLEPSAGQVLVDGVALDEIDPREWYARTAWVGQEPRLLTGTVGENIAFLRDGLDDAAIDRAATAAGLAGELAPDRHVGPAGTSLSGGQRQRVALARALAGDPAVVVLDEPTSALDVQTEGVVRDALDRLRADRIVVVIAHRLSTIRTCDRLLVMDAGRITQAGIPEQVARGDERWLHEALGLGASA